jgi:CheY-like chemotaxis protein
MASPVHILVIDDNSEIHVAIRKALSPVVIRSSTLGTLTASIFDQGAAKSSTPAELHAITYQIDSCTQGECGIRKVRDKRLDGTRYAMAFVDMRMPPGINGIDTAVHLMELDEDIEIVICSAYSDFSWSEVLAQVDSSRKIHLLRKPFDIEQIQKISNVLCSKWTRRINTSSSPAA